MATDELSGLVGWKLLKAIRGRKEVPHQNEGVAVITRRDSDGMTYVRLPGSTIDTPVNGTNVVSADKGDEVAYSIKDGRLSIAGSTSNPAAGTAYVHNQIEPVRIRAEDAIDLASRANAAAVAAEMDAGRAKIAADDAQDSADQAAASAQQAIEDAADASTAADAAAHAASVADGKAVEAKSSADAAAHAASVADGKAVAASQAASAAQASATQANKSATDALTQLSFVEDVAGTLQWIQEHGTFVATTDTSVQDGTVYFEYDSTTQDYVPIVSPPSDANPQQRGWYVLDVTDSQSDFIMAHLAVTTRGLWVLPSGVASTDQTIDNDVDKASASDTTAQRQANANARKGTDYKVLLSSDGMYVYDGSGHLVATYGENIQFSADRPQYIGNDDAYVVFTPEHVESGETVPATVTIGGRVVMGGTQTLAELMHKVDNTLIYDTACTYNQQRTAATIEAHLYRGGVDVRSEYPENCFTWWLKSEDWVQGEPMVPIQSNGNYSCTVQLSGVGYGATVVGRFEPPNDSIALTDDDDTLTDDEGTPISVRTPSGDYVRVSELAVETTVFGTDRIMVVGNDDEHLVTIDTLKEVFGDGDYERLTNRPRIEGVTLTGNKAFTDLGIFRRDQQDYDVPDDYTLTSVEINSLWASAQPIGA